MMFMRPTLGRPRPSVTRVLITVICASFSSGLVLHAAFTDAKPPDSPKLTAPSRSTTIALTSDEQRLVVVNREANSVSVIQVRTEAKKEKEKDKEKDKDKNGALSAPSDKTPIFHLNNGANGGNSSGDVAKKLAEIPVGLEPRCVAVHPNDSEAYVTNGISGTVSVVSLTKFRVAATIRVGTEPRGCALTPDGLLLYVANHTQGTVSIVNTASRKVVGTVLVGRNPTAIAITNKATGNSSAETVFVTQIFAELNPGFSDPTFDGNGEARDLGKREVVHAFPAGNANPPITKITLSPLADSGFTANRANFCPKAIGCPTPLAHLLPGPGLAWN